ncbi:uncharacterized protein HKW66_Vig0247720 [Vigna angularis]|uniref:Uncharacterized protein n=1 Tax=Phaseolus angularis TaxID=3914 RepID=A0A8T0KVE2_PHAAN|nr:uncharacterized protein HKW66_Vig0247720 [Vigna angularis]
MIITDRSETNRQQQNAFSTSQKTTLAVIFSLIKEENSRNSSRPGSLQCLSRHQGLAEEPTSPAWRSGTAGESGDANRFLVPRVVGEEGGEGVLGEEKNGGAGRVFGGKEKTER